MWKKIAIAGAVGASVLGAGSAALALTGSAPTPGSTASSQSSPNAAPQGKHGKAGGADRAGVLKRALHAQFVTGKDGTFVTHDTIRGDVTAVSATSITVKAADGVSQTYVVTSTTKVHTKADKSATISDVKVGVKAGVLGTGATTFTATHIIAR